MFNSEVFEQKVILNNYIRLQFHLLDTILVLSHLTKTEMMKFVIVIFAILWSDLLSAQIFILPSEAAQHIGEKVIITGIINGGTNLSEANFRASKFKFGDSLHAFLVTLLINGHNKNNFEPLPSYLDKKVSITGTLTSTNTKPEIILTDSTQITFAERDLVDTTVTVITTEIMTPPAVNLDDFNGCPLTGQTTLARLQVLNPEKNRWTGPLPSDINPAITVASMLTRGNDTGRWKITDAAEVTGYVLEVKAGGDETCNCHFTDPDKIDTHIVLVAAPNNTKGSQKIIIEVTPRMRFIMSEKGVDWSTNNLKSTFMGHWVSVTGWLFFDQEHTNASENTHPKGAHNWRGTAWEIHPITSITLVNHP